MTGQSTETSVVERALELLAGLKQRPEGADIHDQLARIAGEHAQAHAQLDRTYGVLLHLLLDAYAQSAGADAAVQLNAGSSQLQPSGKLSSAGDLARANIVAMRTESAESLVPDGQLAELRISTAFRLHLDRQRDEIEKLQETLAQNIHDAVNQNRDFGALLKIELSALKQTDEVQDIETLRRILIGGIEEVIKGQQLLESRLHRTDECLGLIKADSEHLRDELHRVRLLSLTDEYTGLPNRRAFMRRLSDEIGRAQRYATPLALVLLDLDEFKSVNDAYGHGGGDEVLRCYASEVLSVLRHHDMVARYGGEEFAVLLPNTTEAGTLAAMHKARQRAQETVCQYEGQRIPLPSFSAGVAMFQPGETSASLIERADRAMYSAKGLGRARVEIAPSLAVAPVPSPEPRETV